eukprot:12810921-Ditylum_brightwellii.AAC.1
MLSAISSKQRASLNDIQCNVEQLYYGPHKANKQARTHRNRMIYFVIFFFSHGVKDPCLLVKSQDQCNFFMAMYAQHLIGGKNLLCMIIKAGTVNLYIKAAPDLCKPRQLIGLIITVDGSKPD